MPSNPQPSHTPDLIVIDWGTTSFRAGLLSGNGTVLERRESDNGILKAASTGFETVLRAEVGGWLGAGRAIVACGMIGSRQGWREVPYVEGATTAVALARGALTFTLADGERVSLLPGVRMADGIRDVMRGEETQIMGSLQDGVAVLPGTHSKWAEVRGGVITGFASFLTGEFFAALSQHTILGKLAEGGEHDAFAFAEGVFAGNAASAPTHDVFAARTRVLSGDMAPSGVSSWLSGFLIGAEIAGADRVFKAPVNDSIMIIGNAGLTKHYQDALHQLGRATSAGPADAAFAGLHRIARMMGK
jgi:2-dehydro-3-deoxygalactonokinase